MCSWRAGTVPPVHFPCALARSDNTNQLTIYSAPFGQSFPQFEAQGGALPSPALFPLCSAALNSCSCPPSPPLTGWGNWELKSCDSQDGIRRQMRDSGGVCLEHSGWSPLLTWHQNKAGTVACRVLGVVCPGQLRVPLTSCSVYMVLPGSMYGLHRRRKEGLWGGGELLHSRQGSARSSRGRGQSLAVTRESQCLLLGLGDQRAGRSHTPVSHRQLLSNPVVVRATAHTEARPGLTQHWHVLETPQLWKAVTYQQPYSSCFEPRPFKMLSMQFPVHYFH